MSRRKVFRMSQRGAIQIGQITNYYGGLLVKENEGKYFWALQAFDNEHWREISKELYDMLLKHNK